MVGATGQTEISQQVVPSSQLAGADVSEASTSEARSDILEADPDAVLDTGVDEPHSPCKSKPISVDLQISPDKDFPLSPEFGDDPPMEGHVNVPVRSKDQDRFHTHPDGRAGKASDSREPLSSVDIVGISTEGSQGEPLCDGMSESDAMVTTPEAAEIPHGMEGVMDDITGLIDQMPLDQVADVAPPPLQYYVPNRNVQAAGVLTDYNPLARPTSRWRCRWRLFSSEDQAHHAASVPGFMARGPRIDRPDFRNPYIKALNNTREELDKSWSLVITEETSATRLASAREGNLSTIQITEVENRELDNASRIGCLVGPLPESCGECAGDRDATDFPVELCEMQHCEQEYDYKVQGAVQGMLAVKSDMHRAGEREEVLMAGFKQRREDV